MSDDDRVSEGSDTNMDDEELGSVFVDSDSDELLENNGCAICLFPTTQTTQEFGGFQATWKEHDVVQHRTMDLCSIVGVSVLHPPDVCVKKILRPNCQAIYHSYELGILAS